MASTHTSMVGWAARVMGILTVLLAWVQWWSESQARREPLASGEIPGTWLQQWAVTTHLLPALLFLIALGLAWRWPLVGALAFGGVALVVTGAVIISALEFGYLVAVIMHAVTGALFFLDWWLGRRPTAVARPAT